MTTARFKQPKRFEDFTFQRETITRYKSADETVNNSSTLQDDADLVFPIGPGQLRSVRYVILYTSGATPDIKFAVTIPSGATLYLRGIGGNAAGTLAEAHSIVSGTAISFQGTGANRLLTLEAVVKAGTVGGLVQLQWAQDTANASDTTVLAGSHLLATLVR